MYALLGLSVPIVIIGLGLWWIVRQRGAKRESSRPIHAFVWLLREPRLFSEDTLRLKVERALAMKFPKGEDATSFVVGQPPAYIVRLGEDTFLVNTFPVPYFNDKQEAASHIREQRRRDAVLQHGAWISADLMTGDQTLTDAQVAKAYRTIGKIAAELHGPDCLALIVTARNWLIPPGDDLLDCLRSDDPLKALGEQIDVPIISVEGNDPQLDAARQEARQRWPEFVAALQAPKPGQSFAVKAPFEYSQGHEFMWLKVRAIEDEWIYGTLDSDPHNVRRLRAGYEVKVKVSDVDDWIISDADNIIGGFSVKALMEAAGRGR